MEVLTNHLLQLVVEWKKCAMSGQKRRCTEIVVTLRTMGYSWPHCISFGDLWPTFMKLNRSTMQEKVYYAVLALQSEEEQWFTQQWKLYKDELGSGEFVLPEKVDYSWAMEDVHNAETWAKEAVDCFGQPLL